MYVVKFEMNVRIWPSVLMKYSIIACVGDRLESSGHKKKRGCEKETLSRARPFSLSPTTSKRLLHRLVLSRKRFLKSFSSSFSFSNLLFMF